MAQYRDIDLPVGVALRVNGDLTIPSNGLVVGGNISGNAIIEGGTALSSKYVLQATSISPGNGLTGGGTLAATRTLSVNFSGNGSGTGVSYANHDHSGAYLSLATGGVLQTNLNIGTVAGQAGLGMQIIVNRYSNTVGTPVFAGNWNNSGYFGLGPKNGTSDNSIQLGIVDSTMNWSANQTGIELYVGSNKAWHAGNLTPLSTTRQILTNNGLIGGGDLSADRTLSVNFSGNGSGTGVAYANHNHDTAYLKLAGGGTVTGNIQFPMGNGLVMDTGTGGLSKARMFTLSAVPNWAGWTLNGQYNGSGWVLDDTANIGWFFKLDVRPSLSEFALYKIPSGAGAHTDEVSLFSVKPDGTAYVSGNQIWHSGNLNLSTYVRNNLTNQSVLGNFTINGTANLYVGDNTTPSSGNIYVRSGANVGIQLDCSSAGKLASTKAYINGVTGDGTFAGTLAVNTISITSSGNIANLNATYINGVPEYKLVKNDSISEIAGFGIHSGMTVAATTVPGNSVDVAAGIFYTDSGRRFSVSAQNKGAIAASATYDRIDALYIQGSITGANEGLLAWQQGVAQASPVAPTIPNGILIANIRIIQNASTQVTVQNSNITDARKFRPLLFDGTNIISRTTIKTDVLDSYGAANITVNQPLKATNEWAKSLQIPSGSASVTWTHNYGNASYVVASSSDSPNRHIFWSGKSGNTIMFNIDDITDVVINIDAILVAI